MSNYLPVPTDAQLHYKPEDHSWLTEELSGNFFAQASYIVNPDDISISLSAANINVDLDQTNASIQTVNANLSGVGEALIGIDIDLNTNLSIVNSNLSSVNTNLGNLLNYNSFVIPPFDEIALSNTTAGNPASAVYLKDSVTVATLVFTYDGDDFMTNAKIVYPA